MRRTSLFAIIVLLALGLGIFVGSQYFASRNGTQGLEGSEGIKANTVSFNRLLNKFPLSYWEWIEGNGMAFLDPLIVVQWPKKDTPFEDTPSDIMLAVQFDSLPFEVELEDKEQCVFQNFEGYDPVCFFPPKGIPVALWPEDWPINKWWFEPGMPAENPQHPGLAHPAFLAIRKNLAGPPSYPPGFEQKYHGLKLAP